jgi:ABC-type uncharacterized transport system permease subunit
MAANNKENTMKRPISLTILALGISVILEAVNVAIGIAILKGREWSRKAYIATAVLGFAFSFVNMPASMYAVLIPGVLLFALFVYLLFRRPATAYFQANA